MSKVRDVLKLRDDMIAQFDALERSDQRPWLAAKMVTDTSKPTSADALLAEGFARILWVRSRFHHDYREGREHLQRVFELFSRLSEENRLLSFLKKDVAIFWGNLCYDNQRYDDAIDLYQQALQNENNPDRKATALLNLARTYLRMRKFYRALESAERIRPETIVKEQQRQMLQLLKARILLILGYKTLAAIPLEAVRSATAKSERIEIEARYLTIFASVDEYDFLAVKPAYESLIAWLEELANPRSDTTNLGSEATVCCNELI